MTSVLRAPTALSLWPPAKPSAAESKTSPAGSSAPPLVLIAKPVTGESADMASTSPAINAAVRSSWLT